MSGKGTGAGGGATLWYRARPMWREAAGAPAAPDALTLAAYLDGSLDETSAEAVETWMAVAPEGLADIQAIREILAAPPPDAPDHVIVRAQAIVRARPVPARAEAGWLRGILAGSAGLLGPAVWAGAVAAVLLASVSGFELGRVGIEHLASLDATVAEDVRLVMGRTTQDLL
jgi:anti-sigma factor RsiW